MALEDQHTSGAYPKRPLAIIRGQGSRVWDAEDKSYLDMTSGQGVALLGHSHPAIAAAIAEQATTLVTCPEIFYNDMRSRVYAELSTNLPQQMDRFFLCNSGAEAVEGALKLARLLSGRTQFIAARNSFHGRTMGALSTTWNPKYRSPFQPLIPEVQHIPFNDLRAAEEALNEQTAAVIIEVVQGEGGVHPAEQNYLQGLREFCSQNGTLLIFDEIQTGFGRTGRWFAFEHAAITPDILCLGKGIANGVPMGAVAWQRSLGTFSRGAHGSTFGGNPLACAASIAALRTLREENLPQRAAEIGSRFFQSLREIEHPLIREVRGLGLMIGIDFRVRVTPLLKALMERGVLALPAGPTVLRFLPPLNVDEDDLAQVRDHLIDSLGVLEHA
jgi:LysW-gamma-L-lysine/LysW-L-ornithine aminotransferase